jgi:hypothetical protein
LRTAIPSHSVNSSTMATLNEQLAQLGPVIFGVGFIAPLIAQSLDATSLSAPLGLSNLVFGLSVGFTMGVIARLRGSWV